MTVGRTAMNGIEEFLQALIWPANGRYGSTASIRDDPV
jgi:hypothetical protein